MTEPYYVDERATLWHGDALEILTGQQGRFSAICLDPPYSMIPNSFAGKDDGAAGSNGSPVRLLHETLGHVRRMLRDGGIAPLVCDWRRVPDLSYIATITGLRIATCVAWTRGRAGTGGLLRSSWDPVLVLSNGSPESVDRAAIPNVIHCDPPGIKDHPYEKPVGLWHHLLQRIPTGIVLDPFAGCGASGQAAIAIGHRWIGIEVDERYCELIAKRLAQDAFDFSAQGLPA